MIIDDGEPTQLSSTTRVVISVQDINDNAPEFDQKTYNVEIPSNAKINQKLFQVSFVVCLLIIISKAPLSDPTTQNKSIYFTFIHTYIQNFISSPI